MVQLMRTCEVKHADAYRYVSSPTLIAPCQGVVHGELVPGRKVGYVSWEGDDRAIEATNVEKSNT